VTERWTLGDKLRLARDATLLVIGLVLVTVDFVRGEF
jgi:hypothetical protein